ncbi:hypothetical protein IYZ83_005950 [Wolbachia pipientis]|uniref:hypothetical protein n=1 Tax=Wolbachia pipientis TaxID=955 RepID=UPI001F41CC3B|nr:hypothetical protein [Wolbachia pipientis]UIP91655.1 hypothetical protein IYZ83_005950 [Wolbachia pipientis]
MGLNYHNLKKHRRNFLDITGFFIEQVYVLKLKYGQGDCIAAIKSISLNAIMFSGGFANGGS